MSDRRPLPDDLRPPPRPSKMEQTASFENQLVQQLCRRYAIPTNVRKEMARTLSDRTGIRRDWLNFTIWHETFPDFPAYLGAATMTHLSKNCTVSKLFLSFGTRKFINPYMDLVASAPDHYRGMPVGLVFRWPHLTNTLESPTGLVLHNRGWSRSVPGVRIDWTPKNDSEETSSQTLCIEHFNVFLNGIDHDATGKKWSPAKE